MKKFLAFFLTITMIVTFIPSVFAAETDGEEKITITCDLENLTTSLGMHTNTNVPLSALSYDSTGGNFRYLRSSLTLGQSFSEVAADIAVKNEIYYPGAKPGSNANYDTKGFISLFSGNYICFEVDVKQDGIYTLKVNHKKGSANNTSLAVYMTDADTFYKSGSFGTKEATFATAGGSGNADSVAIKDWANDQVVFSDRKLTAGKYIITYEAATATNPLWRAVIGSFTLEGTPIVEEPEESAGIGIKYDITNVMKKNNIFYVNSAQDACAEAEKMDFNMTNGFFEVLDARGDMAVGGSDTTTRHYFKLGENATIDFKVNVPETATYFLKTDYQTAGTAYGTSVNIVADGKKVGNYNCSNSELTSNFTGGAAGVWVDGANVSEAAFELTKGEHTISFTVPSDGTSERKYGTVASFELVTSLTSATAVDMDAFLKVSNTTLEVGGEADILGAVFCSSDGTIKAQSGANTECASSNSNVVEVTGSKITAVASGTADITTTIGGVDAKRTIKVLNKEHTGNASLGIYSDVANSATIEINGVSIDDMITSVTIGSTVTATAKTDIPEYIFRGWKRGSHDNGVWWSEEEKITFPMMTNTFLTAVYEPVNAEETVNIEFYNYNGQYIETAKDVGEKKFSEITPKPTPILTGYLNPFWTLDGTNEVSPDATFTKLTRIVANYKNVESFDITIGDGITGATSDEYAYDTELVLHAEKEGTWYIDGKPVAYGGAYLHYVWDDAEITFKDEENNVPIISINDKTKSNGARMISYDANGANIAEVGILFGSEKAEITSFNSKATSKKRGNSQGHYTAMPNDTETSTTARGYLIYNDNGTYRVIYAD